MEMEIEENVKFLDYIKNSSSVKISENTELNKGVIVTFTNNSGKKFDVNLKEINEFINVLKDRNSEISQAIISHPLYTQTGSPWKYQEKPYRSLADKFFPLADFPTINPLIGSQTSGIYKAINAYICFLLKVNPNNDNFSFDLENVESFQKIFSSYSIKKSEMLYEKQNKLILLGPFETAKSAALKSLFYCYENYKTEFENRLIIDEFKAKIDGVGVYLWASERGLEEKKLDSRVFLDKPFEFKGIKYFLSDQWTHESANGRSIKDINVFLKEFNLEIIKTDDIYHLTKINIHHAMNGFHLPKPFLLLAGISGTGKTRFVREQAKASADIHAMAADANYCLVPVRPDWHEPSDLLGYISRIGSNGPRYVATDLLRFIVKAWKHAAASATGENIVCKASDEICPFWLCLDEMNLAPVEQYFADYLSIVETRVWKAGIYKCDPLLKGDVIRELDQIAQDELWRKLDIGEEDDLSAGLKKYFKDVGIPLPPNLIVAGTVNMDETTHGFSRKVIDRALTIDFGEFYPNRYDEFFIPKTRSKTLGFPLLSQIERDDLISVAVDPDGQKTINFLEAVNGILRGTPFELAYRALNEALLTVVCFNPSDDKLLQAVWDDFLMMKVLPRIEGDAEKLDYQDNISLLTRLSDILKNSFTDICNGGRPDLLCVSATDGTVVQASCRSIKKLEWMQKRLEKNGFTTFWP